MPKPTAPRRRKRVFSGMQPSGEAHLGNYLGALRRWVQMQDEYDCLWCIVDDHAITAGGNPQDMPRNVLDLAISYLAVGLDPEKSIIFVQSDVHEHTELAWLFNAVTPVGLGIPTIGFGPGEYKLAHMRNENCQVDQIIRACNFYVRLIEKI